MGTQLTHFGCAQCSELRLFAVPASTLETVQLSGCNALDLTLLMHSDNAVMASLAKGRLKSLDLSQVHHITDAEVRAVLELAADANGHGQSALEAFSVSECRSVSRDLKSAVRRRFAKPKTKSSRKEKRRKRAMERRSRRYSS